MDLSLVAYSDEFKQQVFPQLVPANYYKKYTTGSWLYKLLRFTGIFKSDLYVLKEYSDIPGCILLRKRFSLHNFRLQWFLYGVAVSPEKRGKGYGSELISYTIELCRKLNIREIMLYVEKNNTPAILLYKKNGFEIIPDGKINKLARYKRGNEFLMRKKLK